MGYGSADLTADDVSYTITGLTPGVAYTVHVSALNRHGQGVRAEIESGAVTPPLSVPSAPTNVTVSTKGYNATDGDGIGDSQVCSVYGNVPFYHMTILAYFKMRISSPFCPCL